MTICVEWGIWFWGGSKKYEWNNLGYENSGLPEKISRRNGNY